jgi:pyrroloquinoline-quinone synthase
MNIVERIDREIEKRSVLKHPFYQAWSNGELSLDALRGYAKEYYHLVKHIPIMVEKIAARIKSGDVEENLRDEREHIALWIRFAYALGISREELEAYEPSSKVRSAVDSMLRLMDDPIRGIAAMYAYEAELPKVSITKLDGLIKHYNLNSIDATEYHRVHSMVDIKHAAVWRKLLNGLRDKEHEEAYNAAVESLVAQNLLLDGVYEKYIQCN